MKQVMNYHKDNGNGIPTPHVHENGKVRPAKKEDL